jgi:hypothetical protein
LENGLKKFRGFRLKKVKNHHGNNINTLSISTKNIHHHYNAENRLEEIEEYDGSDCGSPGTLQQSWEFSYDGVDGAQRKYYNIGSKRPPAGLNGRLLLVWLRGSRPCSG